MSHAASPYPLPDALLNVDVVLAQLLNAVNGSPGITRLPLKQAHGRVLAQDMQSPLSVPPFDNSAVDGYALHLDSHTAGQTLNVSQRIPAGCDPAPLQPGTAARIFTGATIPRGANAVIMQEDVRLLDDGGKVAFSETLKPGQNIRPAGQDIRVGETLAFRGQILSPQRLGMLASVGLAEVPVYQPLRVAFLSTGDELVEPGQALQPGQIYNSNRYLLQALIEELGLIPVDLGVVKDTLADTCAALQRGTETADVILTTGGASVGEEDHVQAALSQGGQMDLWRVAIKPGKPFMFGQFGTTPVLGLPGNPAAVLVTFLMLARPWLLRRQGVLSVLPRPLRVAADFNVAKPGKRREFLRVRLNEDGYLQQYPNQSSGMLSSAAWAEGLAVVPENQSVAKGDLLDYLPFAQLFRAGD